MKIEPFVKPLHTCWSSNECLICTIDRVNETNRKLLDKVEILETKINKLLGSK